MNYCIMSAVICYYTIRSCAVDSNARNHNSYASF